MLILILSCWLTVTCSGQSVSTWQPDSDQDFFISVTDVLAVLSVFGQSDADEDGLWDSADLCTDVEACNYSANPSLPCAYLDASGVCGGSSEIPELLLGSWMFSQGAGALEIGPSPGSNLWYSSEPFGLQSAQYDDVYSFTANGTLFANYNGSIIDAFSGYSEQNYECTSIDIDFNSSGESDELATIELLPASTSCSCPFIGANDAGLTYTITNLSETTLELQAQGDNSNCESTEAYFTFTFVRMTEDINDGSGYPAPESYPGMELVWSDEFSGTAVNSENWTYDLGNNGWGNNEWQNYTN